MSNFKRFVLISFSAMMCALLLTACGLPPLPDGVTEDMLADAAKVTVSQLSKGDYEALVASFDDTMKEQLPADKLHDAWEPTRTAAGAFVEQTSAQYLGKDSHAVAVVTVKYENQSVVFTLSYNTDLQLSGLYFK